MTVFHENYNRIKFLLRLLLTAIRFNGHTLKCRRDRREEERANVRYKKKWPGYCKECNGEGGQTEVSNDYWEPDSWEACMECGEKGECPRCGGLVDEEELYEGTLCPHCDWDIDNPDMLPYDTRFMDGCDCQDPEFDGWDFMTRHPPVILHYTWERPLLDKQIDVVLGKAPPDFDDNPTDIPAGEVLRPF